MPRQTITSELSERLWSTSNVDDSRSMRASLGVRGPPHSDTHPPGDSCLAPPESSERGEFAGTAARGLGCTFPAHDIANVGDAVPHVVGDGCGDGTTATCRRKETTGNDKGIHAIRMRGREVQGSHGTV